MISITEVILLKLVNHITAFSTIILILDSVLTVAKIHLKNLLFFIDLISLPHLWLLLNLKNLTPRLEIRFLDTLSTDIVTFKINDRTTRMKSNLFQLSSK